MELVDGRGRILSHVTYASSHDSTLVRVKCLFLGRTLFLRADSHETLLLLLYLSNIIRSHRSRSSHRARKLEMDNSTLYELTSIAQTQPTVAGAD